MDAKNPNPVHTPRNRADVRKVPYSQCPAQVYSCGEKVKRFNGRDCTAAQGRRYRDEASVR